MKEGWGVGLCRYRGERECSFFLGITGTWEGWVPTATDLYLRGNITPLAGNFTSSSTMDVKLDAGQITIMKERAESQSSTYRGMVATNQINLTRYNYINFEYVLTSVTGGPVQFDIGIVSRNTTTSPAIKNFVNGWYTLSSKGIGSGTVSFNIANINVLAYIHIGFISSYGLSFMGAIYRIWLS